MIEVGLGGVRDATNVLPPASLAAAVIAAVGHDHAAALGGGIEQIAAAKAGIMQAGRPVVLARHPEAAAQAVLLRRGEPVRGGETAARPDHKRACANSQHRSTAPPPTRSARAGLPRRRCACRGAAGAAATGRLQQL